LTFVSKNSHCKASVLAGCLPQIRTVDNSIRITQNCGGASHLRRSSLGAWLGCVHFFRKRGGDFGPPAGFSRSTACICKSSRDAPASGPNFPCVCESACGGPKCAHPFATRHPPAAECRVTSGRGLDVVDIHGIGCYGLTHLSRRVLVPFVSSTETPTEVECARRRVHKLPVMCKPRDLMRRHRATFRMDSLIRLMWPRPIPLTSHPSSR
jgi:hypothetical protein